MAGDLAQWLKRLPGKCELVSSIPGTKVQKKNNNLFEASDNIYEILISLKSLLNIPSFLEDSPNVPFPFTGHSSYFHHKVWNHE